VLHFIWILNEGTSVVFGRETGDRRKEDRRPKNDDESPGMVRSGERS